jgi:ketosteroid isomerase-like protein
MLASVISTVASARDTERAMSRENVEVVRGVYAATNRGDRERALGFAHPEIVIDATRRVFNPTTYVGMEGLGRMLADMDEVWEEFRTEPLEFIDAGDRVVVVGDRVVVVGHLVGNGKASGVEVRQPIAGIWTVRDGRIVRAELGYTDRREALEAAGLRE